MLSVKSWKVVPFAACLSLVGACGTAQDGTSTEEVTTPAAGSAGRSAPATSGSAGSAAKPAAGTAGMQATSPAGSSAAMSAGAGGAAGSSAVSAVAVLEPFMAGATSAGAAGAAATAGAGGATATAGAGGAAGKAGAAGSSANAGTGGRAGAGGDGAGAGVAALSGTATFTKASSTQVDVNIEVSGCEDGKSYPVHIHEGTSCESTATQGAHWGEPQAFMISAAGAGGSAAGAGAAGSGGSGAGSGGHDASHAGSGGSGAGGTGGPATSFKYRGEGIPDIKCTGTTGTTLAKRNSFDRRVTWSLGTGDESDVVGHVVVVHDGAARIACGKIELK